MQDDNAGVIYHKHIINNGKLTDVPELIWTCYDTSGNSNVVFLRFLKEASGIAEKYKDRDLSVILRNGIKK